MIDINYITFKNKRLIYSLKKRHYTFNYTFFKYLNNKIIRIKNELYKIQCIYNFFSLFIKNLKDNILTFNYITNETNKLKEKILEKKYKLNYLEEKKNSFLLSIPNLIDKSVPTGISSTDNIEIRSFYISDNYKIKKKYILNDLELNKSYIDFELSAKITSSGFVILKHDIASLHRALGNYMLDLHIYINGYNEIYSPNIVNEQSMINTGHFPKFYNDQFNISNSNLWLIPTAEVVLANIIAQTKIHAEDLPIKFVSKTLCFRKEKGNYGYKVKGLIRQHQFEKVELVQIVSPQKSYNALEEVVFHAETVLQNLNLPYRVVLLCSGDTGFTSCKTYDIEVWFPKRKSYIEVSSCSNTESFQSLRMNSKIDNKKSKLIEYPHILNGSGLAIGRILLAIIENYTDINGNIIIPNPLIKYMNGKKSISFNT